CIIRPEDARYILNIRPSSTKGQDTLIWNYTTMGEYTVKSGYHMYNQMQKQYRSDGQESREILPQKSKHFGGKFSMMDYLLLKTCKERTLRLIKLVKYVEKALKRRITVTKEIWSLVPTSFGKDESVQTDTHQNIKEMITLVKKDKREHLNFYIGWRIGRMRNSLLFQQKREHILKVIHDALRDSGQWEEENNQSKQEDRVGRSCMHPHEEQEAIPAEYQYFCHVDAFWKDEKEVAAPTKILLNQPNKHTKRSRNNGITHGINFISDCKSLVDELNQYNTAATITKVRNTECISMIQNIVEASKANEFTFSYVRRSRLSLVDELARKARCNIQNNVIGWF
ncbi:hypothetical protein HID58_059681, partial [Brassica napus]